MSLIIIHVVSSS